MKTVKYEHVTIDLYEIDKDGSVYTGVQYPDGTFEVFKADWKVEDTGDAESGPDPVTYLGPKTEIASGLGDVRDILCGEADLLMTVFEEELSKKTDY